MKQGIFAVASLLLSACSDGTPQDTTDADVADGDAQVADDAEAGPAPRCDVSKPFGAPKVDANLSFNGHGGYAFLTSDELTAYVSADIYGACSIWSATRTSTDVPFGQPALVSELNGGYVQQAFSLTGNGLMGAFVKLSTYSANDGRLFVTQRASTSATFGTAQEQTSLNVLNSSNRAPYISSDGMSLYYASNQSGTFKLYVAHGQGGSFAGGQLVAFGTAPKSDAYSPVLSPDELTMYFSANAGTWSGPHVEVATRADKSATFGAPKPVDAVNDYSSVADYPSWVSADGCVLYGYRVTYTNLYTSNVWVATRPM